MHRSSFFLGLLLGLLYCVVASCQVKVAVIDSGFNPEAVRHVKLCPSGHYDFIARKAWVGRDQLNHGTDVVVTIASYAQVGTCFLVYKVFDKYRTPDGYSGTANDVAYAVTMAMKQGAKVLNLSLSGLDNVSKVEYDAIEEAVRSGIKVYVASGNNGYVLVPRNCRVYPACYEIKGMVVVGSKENKLANDGYKVNQYEHWCAGTFCGTSASTAIATGKYLH